MKRWPHVLRNVVKKIVLAAFALISASVMLRAQGTAFMYQGRLNNGVNPATGTYNFTFSLFNASSNGVALAGPLAINNTIVSNGLFSVVLDFGSGVFNGQGCWLQIGVETNGGNTFTTLTPLQPVLPVPYAVMAASAGSLLGSVSSAQISGNIPASQISGTLSGEDVLNVLFFNKVATANLSGIFTGDGSGLNNVNATQLGGISASGFEQPSANTLFVSPSGNNSTGQRGTGNAYANLYAATAAAHPGDVIYIEKGTYFEGANIVGVPPKNLSIHGLGQPVIVYTLTNGGPALVFNNIYLEPADNLVVDGLVFSTPCSNYFSAFFGSYTGCPSATNVQVSISSLNADSDGMYFEGQNLLNLTAFNCIIHGYWDTMTTFTTLNTNDLLTFKSCEFDVDRVTGLLPSNRRGVNVSGGGNLVFDNCRIHDALPLPGKNYGIQVQSPNVNLVLNGIGFNDAGNGYADLFVPSTTFNLAINNLFSETTNGLVISPQFPTQTGGSQLFGRLTVPMNVSQFPGVAQSFGSWNLLDEGTNGTMILTNENNQGANIPAYVEFQPNDDAGGGSGNPLGGALNLHNMVLSLQTNYSPLNFAPPEPGQVNFVVSNNWVWTVTATTTNRQFQISQ